MVPERHCCIGILRISRKRQCIVLIFSDLSVVENIENTTQGKAEGENHLYSYQLEISTVKILMCFTFLDIFYACVHPFV